MEIIKGTTEYLDECIAALKDSELGRYYFSREDSVRDAVEEGLNAGTLYIAVEGTAFQGFLYYIPNGAFHSFPYLHLIVTKASERGKGVGAKMLLFLESIVNKPKIFLCVADFNPNAKRFYEKSGYMQVGRIESLYRLGIAENLMMKEINK
ncbi:MAG: GNAT family N-acetyltransferase [Eubacteriales bacterium]|nr:GNAT family N-acetyltransferase [Eubacteriales bacterium]